MNRDSTAMPLVSVGMPAYNRPDLLDRAIHSIRLQTWSNLEIIISNNASDDPRVASIIAIHAEQDPRIRLFSQEKNIGALRNFCFVLEKSKADYFMWAADDDLCEPDFVEKLVRPLMADADLILTMSDIVTVNLNGEAIRVDELHSIRLGAEKKQVRQLFFEYPTSNIFFCIYGLYRASVLKKIEIAQLAEYRGLASHGEVPFLAKIATMGCIASIPGQLKRYTSHQDSVYYTELAQMTRWIKFRLDLGIRMRLLQIALNADLPMSARGGLGFVVLRSWAANFWKHDVLSIKNRMLARCIGLLRAIKKHLL